MRATMRNQSYSDAMKGRHLSESPRDDDLTANEDESAMDGGMEAPRPGFEFPGHKTSRVWRVTRLVNSRQC